MECPQCHRPISVVIQKGIANQAGMTIRVGALPKRQIAMIHFPAYASLNAEELKALEDEKLRILVLKILAKK